jgi:hypothetical protein
MLRGEGDAPDGDQAHLNPDTGTGSSPLSNKLPGRGVARDKHVIWLLNPSAIYDPRPAA